MLGRVGAATDAVASPLGGIASRYGGKELVVAVPRTGRVEAAIVTEDLLEAVSSMAIPYTKNRRGFVAIMRVAAKAAIGKASRATSEVSQARVHESRHVRRRRWPTRACRDVRPNTRTDTHVIACTRHLAATRARRLPLPPDPFRHGPAPGDVTAPTLPRQVRAASGSRRPERRREE